MSTDHGQFILRYTQVQEDLRRYVYSLCHDWQTMEEIVQETALSLWKKLDSYDPEQPFRNWAMRFAYYETMKNFERHAKRQRLSVETLQLLAELAADGGNSSSHLQVQTQLEGCINELGEEQQALLDLRYGQGMRVTDMTEKLERSSKSLYRALDRIRDNLRSCLKINGAQL